MPKDIAATQKPFLRRARPKYLASTMFELLFPIKPSSGELYFNRGSSALKFVLLLLRERLGRPPVVCMQSFNCNTVLEAALEAGAEVLLADIKLTDFSVPFEFVSDNSKQIDVLLLLHYQGQRNTEHETIATFCKENAIFLIEDIAHCPDCDWPLLGDLGLASYAFDKPFSCMAGGGLLRGTVERDLWHELRSRFERLPEESSRREASDLAALRLLLEVTSLGVYQGKDVPLPILKTLNFIGVSPRTIAFAACSRAGSLLLRLIAKGASGMRFMEREKYPISRLRGNKIALLDLQRRNYFKLREECEGIANEVARALSVCYRIAMPAVSSRTNRLALLCDERVRSEIVSLGIEAGPYNWPTPLHLISKGGGIRTGGAKFPNSETSSRMVLNVPVWSREVTRRVASGGARAIPADE